MRLTIRHSAWKSHLRLRAVIACLSHGGGEMCNYWTLVISACDAIPHSPPFVYFQSARYTAAQLAVPHGARCTEGTLLTQDPPSLLSSNLVVVIAGKWATIPRCCILGKIKSAAALEPHCYFGIVLFLKQELAAVQGFGPQNNRQNVCFQVSKIENEVEFSTSKT